MQVLLLVCAYVTSYRSPEFDPNDARWVYACDGYPRYGVALSEDGGESWAVAPRDNSHTYAGGVHGIAQTFSRYAGALAFGAGNAPMLFAGTIGSGLYRSQDNGLSWNAVTRENVASLVVCPHPARASIVLIYEIDLIT